MDERRLKGLMGLSVRAGQAVFGEGGCEKVVRGGQAALLLMDDGISHASAEKLERACSREGVSLMRLRTGLLAEATGRPGRVMALRPGAFADQIRAAAES